MTVTSRTMHPRGLHLSEGLLGIGTASVRTAVTVPLRFSDGYSTTGRVMTFRGLLDGKEHLAVGLGDWEGAGKSVV